MVAWSVSRIWPALMSISPPGAVAEVLLAICAPPVSVKRPTVTEMSPAALAPAVLVLMNPRSMVSVDGVEITTRPGS